ncbi:MAG: hypothetical protein SGJ27_21415 [Candidatus Melainabacteria bacterium]|nr:hypothetical protein [Candidatus Melainabacteria bacterium]
MTDVEKSNDDVNKKPPDAPKPPIESSTGGELAKPYQENFTSFSSEKALGFSSFMIEDAQSGVSISAQGTKPIDSSNVLEALPSPNMDTENTFASKANEILEAAGTFKIPTEDQIAIGKNVYNKTDVMTQAGQTGKNRTVLDGSSELLKGFSKEELNHLKTLKEKIAKSDEVHYFGNVSSDYKKHMDHWWKTVPESTKQMMKAHKIHVVVAENTNQIYPNADKMLARGHGQDSIATTGGMYSPHIGAVVMVENTAASPNMQKSNEIAKQVGTEKHGLTQWEVVRKAWHELGHALDYEAANHLARSPEFNNAFNAGLARLTPLDRKNWTYFVSSKPVEGNSHLNDGPNEELLADMFILANVPTDKGYPKPYDSEFRMFTVFKEVADLMKAKQLIPKEDPTN